MSTADLKVCRAMLRDGSKSFFAASLILPPSIRNPASALYAFCRFVDDAVDLDGGRLPEIERLRGRLDRAYAGRPFPEPIDRAFANVVNQFGIPRTLPEAVLQGLEWDATGRRYESINDLYGYAARVAGAVGAMMTLIMGVRCQSVIARACDLGVAMQLTNIARDVGEDARNGRVYLPTEWLQAAGIDPDKWLAAPEFNEALGTVIQRLLDTAKEFYANSLGGISALPLGCRPGIHAARLLYSEIGRQLARNGLDSVQRRTIVSSRRKVQLLAQATSATLQSHDKSYGLPLAENKFLLDAIAAEPAPALDKRAAKAQTPSFDDRIAWVFHLFETLERREQLAKSAD